MTIAFISDLHLSAQRPSSISLFVDFMDKSGRLLSDLYILGDLFDYWVGDDASQVLGFSEVEKALKKTTDSGTNVFFIAGNRDFLVGEDFAQRTGVQILDDMHILQRDGQRIMLAHGDRFCIDDKAYMDAREQMLDKKWQQGLLAKTIEQRIAIALDLREQSEMSKQQKSAEIMDVNADEINRILIENNLDILIHGHTHRPYVHQIKLQGKTFRRYVLGEWNNKRSVIYGNQGKYYLKGDPANT